MPADEVNKLMEEVERFAETKNVEALRKYPFVFIRRSLHGRSQRGISRSAPNRIIREYLSQRLVAAPIIATAFLRVSGLITTHDKGTPRGVPFVLYLGLQSYGTSISSIFAVLAPVQHIDLALAIAKDEDIAVAKLAFLYRFLDRHGPQGDGILRAHQVSFRGAGNGRELVHHDGHGRGGGGADGNLHFGVGFDRSRPALVFGLAVRGRGGGRCAAGPGSRCAPAPD